MSHSQLQFIECIDGISYYQYSPRLFQWYYKDYPENDKMTFRHFARMFVEFIRGGYKVYYMKKGEEFVGYLVVTPGGRRLTCSTKKDIVIGPIWIRKAMRGEGLGTKGVSAIIHSLEQDYEIAYEYIKVDNYASIRSVQKNGFEKVGFGTEMGLLRKVVVSETGRYLVYKYCEHHGE